ncbi:MAG: Gfo/Idh/MocA family oxidoreductase [Planctomycetota bacterium]|nr:Gfo/Idh/MocA family oxidoreductase [Planctomycetota bacterium]
MSYQREYERRLKVAVVGVGSHCYRNVLPALTFLPVEVRAFCDMNLELARKTAREYGVPAVYASTAELYAKEDLDAAILCVGPAQHPPLALEALKAGLHVWLEKPPALRAAQVAEMLEHRGSKTVVVGFKKAFMPATLKARELLAQPEFGALKSLLGIFPMDVPADAAAVLAESRYTDWLGNGVHPLSLLVDVGGPVKAVTVHRGAHGGGACILEYASGAIGNFHLAAGASRAQPIENYYLFGERGHILIENGLRVVYQRGIPFQYGKSTTFAPEGLDHGALVWEAANTLATLENKALFTQGMWGELKHFCDAALAGQPATRGTLELALEVMKVYEAALKSGGRRIEL